MKIKHNISIQGTAVENEDVIGYVEDYFWIIDGATDLFNSKSLIGYSVSEVVKMLSEILTNHCDHSRSLEENFCFALDEVRQRIGEELLDKYPSYQLPSFAFVYGRVNQKRLEYILLGDCVLFANHQEITDHRVDEFFEQGKQDIKQAMKENPSLDKKEILRKIRMRLNQPDGYWIGSLDGAGVEHALSDIIELKNPEVLLMTDGFYDFYHQHPSKTIEELIELRRKSLLIDPIYEKKDDASLLALVTE